MFPIVAIITLVVALGVVSVEKTDTTKSQTVEQVDHSK